MTVKGFFKGIWQFVSFLFVPQQGKHITEQAQSYAEDDLKKQVTYLIGKEIEEGRTAPITPEFVAATLHVSLPEATDALKSATGKIPGK